MRPPTTLDGSQSPIRAKADGALAVKGTIDEFEEFEKFPVPPTDSQRASVRSITTIQPMSISMQYMREITHGLRCTSAGVQNDR